MSGELNDKDPFADAEPADEANYITEGMVRKATYLIHKLADRKGQDYKEIQTKCKKLFAYTNLAKVTLEDGHAMISKLIELTGGEEERPPLDSTVKDNLTHEKTVQEPTEKEEEIVVQDESVVVSEMREAVRAAVDITQKEVVKKEIPVMGLGGFVLEIAKVIFDAKMKEEASK